MKEGKAVILFPTSAHVMRAEKLIKRAGFWCRLIPVPRHMSSDCGVCLVLQASDTAAARGILDEGRVDFEDLKDYT